jgi:hypothetical protein
MKRLPRDYAKLESLNLFSALQPRGSASLHGSQRRTSFLAEIDAGLDRALTSESTLHGIRVQMLFEHMVPSFQSVKLMKQEDAGDCFAGDIEIPDYRIVTDEGSSMLVEVKNHYTRDPRRPFRIKRDYLRQLAVYADLLGTPLRLAIYWARWNAWTLIDPTSLAERGQYVEIDFGGAMQGNTMAQLGDYMIGAQYPLVMRLIADSTKPRQIAPNGHAHFTIGRVEISCAGRLLHDKPTQNLAFQFMMFGQWNYSGSQAETADGKVVAVTHTIAPSETTPGQGFEIIGTLSSLFSARYNMLTLAEDGKVNALQRFDDPTGLCPLIPHDYQSDDLPLWRFRVRPKMSGSQAK